MYDVERFRRQAQQTAREQGYVNPCDEITRSISSVRMGRTLVQGYIDAQHGVDNSVHTVLGTSFRSSTVVAGAVMSASASGAGSLAGYAGLAHVVSTMGLGGATTAIAGSLGSSATGAAATALVTATVGGPVVMGAILIGGTGAAAYGLYKIGRWVANL